MYSFTWISKPQEAQPVEWTRIGESSPVCGVIFLSYAKTVQVEKVVFTHADCSKYYAKFRALYDIINNYGIRQLR